MQEDCSDVGKKKHVKIECVTLHYSADLEAALPEKG